MMETSSPHPSADHESQCANQLMPGAGAGSGAGAVGGAEDLLQAFPLHRACRDGDLPALAVILGDSVVSLCDAVAQDPLFGWTPAHWAAHNGKVDCLEMLMKAGMPCNISSQGPGLTLAHVAALEGQSLCLAWLCQHGVNMNAQDHMGETAAHKAVRCGSVECLHILREHGADFSIQSSIGVTVMELAVQAHQAQCVQYFSAGGDAGHHMTPACLNGASGGRRKRLSVDDGAEAEVTDDTGVAKRARVDSAELLWSKALIPPHSNHSNPPLNSFPHSAFPSSSSAAAVGTGPGPLGMPTNGCSAAPSGHAGDIDVSGVGFRSVHTASVNSHSPACATPMGTQLLRTEGDDEAMDMVDTANGASVNGASCKPTSNGSTQSTMEGGDVLYNAGTPVTNTPQSGAMGGSGMRHHWVDCSLSSMRKPALPKCNALRGHYL